MKGGECKTFKNTESGNNAWYPENLQVTFPFPFKKEDDISLCAFVDSIYSFTYTDNGIKYRVFSAGALLMQTWTGNLFESNDNEIENTAAASFVLSNEYAVPTYNLAGATVETVVLDSFIYVFYPTQLTGSRLAIGYSVMNKKHEWCYSGALYPYVQYRGNVSATVHDNTVFLFFTQTGNTKIRYITAKAGSGNPYQLSYSAAVNTPVTAPNNGHFTPISTNSKMYLMYTDQSNDLYTLDIPLLQMFYLNDWRNMCNPVQHVIMIGCCMYSTSSKMIRKFGTGSVMEKAIGEQKRWCLENIPLSK